MDMSFRNFVDEPQQKASEWEVLNLYLQSRQTPVREIAQITGHSVGELYRILHRHGNPNRIRNNQAAVLALADANMSPRQIGDMTGYTPRHVRNILAQRETPL